MSFEGGESPWHELPGAGWTSLDDARQWLENERARLNWAPKDLIRAFGQVAFKSDLWSPPGHDGGYQGPTVRNVMKFEAGKPTIKTRGKVNFRFDLDLPDWLFWIPLAIERSEVPLQDQGNWDRANIPFNRDVRCEVEEAEYFENATYLRDDELELLELYNALNEQSRSLTITTLRAATSKTPDRS